MPPISLKLAKPVKSVRIANDYSSNTESSVMASNARQIEELKAQKSLYSDACRTVQNLAAKLNQFYEKIFVEQSEEIARKVLMQKVQDGDYKIESIIKEILKNAPTHQDLVVRLNSQDMADCQKIQQDGGGDELASVKLVADANIGRAECVLESPKGIIKSLIDEHLEQIAKALNKKTE